MAEWLLTQLLAVKLISSLDDDFAGIQNVSKWWEARIKQASKVRQHMKDLEARYVKEYTSISQARENLVAVFTPQYEKGQDATNKALEYATADTIKRIIKGLIKNATNVPRIGAKDKKEGAEQKKEQRQRRAQVSKENLSLLDATCVSKLTAFQGTKSWPFWLNVKLRLFAMPKEPPFDQAIVDFTRDLGFVGKSISFRTKFDEEWDELKKRQASVGIDPAHPHGSDEEPPEKKQKLDTDTMDSGIGMEDLSGAEVVFRDGSICC